MKIVDGNAQWKCSMKIIYDNVCFMVMLRLVKTIDENVQWKSSVKITNTNAW